jgi:hypothetical protein
MSNTFQQVALSTLIRKRRGDDFLTDNSGIPENEYLSESSVEPWTPKRPRISQTYTPLTPPLITVSPAQGVEPELHTLCPSTQGYHPLPEDGNGDASSHIWSPRSPVTFSSNASSVGSPFACNEWDNKMEIDSGNSFDGMYFLWRGKYF